MSRPSIKDWEAYQSYFDKELSSIIIPEEIETHVVKHLTYRLNKLYDEVFFEFTRHKSLYENIDDLVDEVKYRNMKGSNAEDRKKNAYDSVANYVNPKGVSYNLFEYRRQYREKYNFLKAVIDSINSKKSSLITDSGVLKIEASLLSG